MIRWSRTHTHPPPLPQSAPRLSTPPLLGLHRSILLCRHIASRSSLVSGSDGLHALLLTAGRARGVAVSGLASPPPSSQHVRLPSMGQLEPHHPHRAWDGSRASDVSDTGGSFLPAPAHLSDFTMTPFFISAALRSPSSLSCYRRRFGPAARNCQPPCCWESE